MRAALIVLQKELLLEWRQRARISGLFFFALAVVVMVAFASPTEGILKQSAGGTLWIALLLASTRSLDQSYVVEMENGALEGLILWPVDGVSLFFGKALANMAVLIIVAVAVTPLLIAMYDAPLKGNLWLGPLFLVLGTAALAAPGTLYGLITAQSRGSSVLLPMLLFPLVIPAILAAAKGTTLVMHGDAMGQAWSWLGLLLAFAILHWSLSGLFFAQILEDG
ncbi:MAG: transcriptional regulator [Proteobacteria bacterium]|jgi:heme exporter protein B|nr:transcriptional regulator [Pseudomonadota bacterium]